MKVQCLSCGKTYDYLKTDLCPKCGAYNSPSDQQRNSLEQQILRDHGYDCTPDCMPKGYGSHDHRASAQYSTGSYRTSAGSQATRDAKRLENSQASHYDGQSTRRNERAGAAFSSLRGQRDSAPSGNSSGEIIRFVVLALFFLLFLVKFFLPS